MDTRPLRRTEADGTESSTEKDAIDMAVTQGKPGPYSPSTAIMGIVERYRDRGLPTPITADVLTKAGLVSDSLMARTLYALQILDLIDAAGNPTETLEAIRRAPAGEYKARLSDWLTHAYSDVLAYVDPATADEDAVHDAFRLYNPSGQRGRMVTLFMGLFRAAGLAPDKPAGAGSGVLRKKPTLLVKKRAEKPQDQAVAEKAKGDRASDGAEGRGSEDGKLPSPDFRAALLDKFPTFDPAWPDEIKAKWFDGFATFTKELGPK